MCEGILSRAVKKPRLKIGFGLKIEGGKTVPWETVNVTKPVSLPDKGYANLYTNTNKYYTHSGCAEVLGNDTYHLSSKPVNCCNIKRYILKCYWIGSVKNFNWNDFQAHYILF